MPVPSARPKRPLLGATGLATMLVAVAVVFGHPASGDESDSGLESIGTLAPDDRLDPRLLELDFDGSAYRRAVERLETGLFDREETRRDLRAIRRQVDALQQRVAELGTMIGSTTEALRVGDVELGLLETELATRAVERFVRHGGDLGDMLDPGRSIEAGRSERLSVEVDEAQLDRRAGLLVSREELESTLTELRTESVFAGTSLAAGRDEQARLEQRELELEAELEAATAEVVSARRTARVAGTGIPTIAIDAYLTAEVRMHEIDPGCRLRWWMIAAVARVESRHAELGGRRLRADGRVDDPIVGVPLDGGPGVLLVVDTDDGRLDGDPDLDRAVGPLQFIPETWERLGRDGNGDGVEDPQNIYDAALAAAGYLCLLGSDLGDASDLRGAYLGYNSSQDYVEAVIGHAVRYAELTVAPPPDPSPQS